MAMRVQLLLQLLARNLASLVSRPAALWAGLIAVWPTARFALSVLRQLRLGNCTGQTIGVASSMKDVKLSLFTPWRRTAGAEI
jgi:hypothetical protein